MDGEENIFSKAYGAVKLIRNRCVNYSFTIEDNDAHDFQIPIKNNDNCSVGVFIVGGDVVEASYYASNQDVKGINNVDSDRWINVHYALTNEAGPMTNALAPFDQMNYIDTSISNNYLVLRAQRTSGTGDTTVVTVDIKYW